MADGMWSGSLTWCTADGMWSGSLTCGVRVTDLVYGRRHVVWEEVGLVSALNEFCQLTQAVLVPSTQITAGGGGRVIDLDLELISDK